MDREKDTYLASNQRNLVNKIINLLLVDDQDEIPHNCSFVLWISIELFLPAKVILMAVPRLNTTLPSRRWENTAKKLKMPASSFSSPRKIYKLFEINLLTKSFNSRKFFLKAYYAFSTNTCTRNCIFIECVLSTQNIHYSLKISDFFLSNFSFFFFHWLLFCAIKTGTAYVGNGKREIDAANCYLKRCLTSITMRFKFFKPIPVM